MAALKRRCRANLWHLFVLLSLSVCIILSCIYYLNAYLAHDVVGIGSSLHVSDRDSFKADFRTLPHTLPGGRRRLVVLVNSHWKHFDRRLAIRNTWATNQYRLNFTVYFVLGDSDDDSVSAVIEEGAFFHDIIQPSVREHEQNVVLKLLASFRFLEREFDADFVMKTNDDVFVNLPEIAQFLHPYANAAHQEETDDNRSEKLIIGNRLRDSRVRKDLSNLWPRGAPIPDYVSGYGYILSFDVMRRFNLCPKFVQLLPTDDVYFTGACRDHFGLSLQHNEKFAFNPKSRIPCLWKSKFITGHANHKEMEVIWNTINKQSILRC